MARKGTKKTDVETNVAQNVSVNETTESTVTETVNVVETEGNNSVSSDGVALPAEFIAQLNTPVSEPTQQQNLTVETNETMLRQARIMFGFLLHFTDTVSLTRAHLKTEFSNQNPFKDEYAVLYDVLTANTRVDIDEEFMQIYLLSNRYAVEHSTNVNLQKYELGTEDVYAAFSQSLLTLFVELKKETVAETAYETALAKYKMLYLTEQSITLLETGVEILVDGKKIRGRDYSGFDGMRNYLSAGFNNLDKIKNQKKTRGAVCYGVTSEEEEQEFREKPLGTLGLPGIDDAYTVYAGDMINILGAPKAGKSRACVQVINHMCVDNGVNCLIWSLENGFKGWERMYRVREFNRVYNKTVGSVTQKKILMEDMLKDGADIDPEIRDLELASWMAFKHNQNFGTLTNVEEPFCYDNFLDILDGYVKKFDVQFICIDYLGMIDPGKTGPKEVTPLVADVYKRVKQYLLNNRLAGIFPMHIKQDLITPYGNMTNAELADADLRDAAGLSNEVIKTPDVNMALIATKKQIEMGSVRLVPILSRTVEFQLTELSVDFPSSTFIRKP